jgi:hypothetical protein
MTRKVTSLLTVVVLFVVACSGQAVLVEQREGDLESAAALDAEDELTREEILAQRAGDDLELGQPGAAAGGGRAGGDPKCATNSDPSQGFTESSLKIGTIIPLTGALRPLGEQTARVMRLTVENVNRNDTLGPHYEDFNWGCSERPGIFGRKLELKIFSMQNNTSEEALAGMRRLIDVEKVFMVRDCYLVSSLLGAAVQYQNSKQVPGVWCYYLDQPLPQLAAWNFAPGTDPQIATAINIGHAIRRQNKSRLAVLADPTTSRNLVPVVRRVARHLGARLPNDCIVYKRAQEAPNGMRSEITRIRTCYGGGTTPDLVVALDALNGVFGAMEAKSQGWRGADHDVHWTCTGLSCWITSLADLCGDACERMTTNCASLPCIPWASGNQFAAAAALRQTHREYLSREPEDILTYGPAAITGGIALWLTMTGPELSQERFRHTLENLRNWNAGIGPILNTSPQDRFGGKSIWIIRFTGRSPWFNDVTGGFLTLQDVGVPERVVRG